MSAITPAALSARLATVDDDDPYVLDVQPESDYEDWHIPGSMHLDVYEELRNEPEAARAALRTIPGNEVVIVRTAGAASEKAAELLRELGYDVKMLACRRP